VAVPTDPRPAEEIATAKNLFSQALALQKAGKLDASCDMFESSLRLDPQIGTRLNVADCRERQGRLVEAHALFEDSADQAMHAGDRRASFALQRVQALDAKLVRVTVNIAAPETPGLTIKLGACVVASVRPSVQDVVMPGSIVVDASAPSRLPFHVERDGAAGADITIDVPALDAEHAAEDTRKAKEADALAAAERRRAAQIAADRERERSYNRHPTRKWTIVSAGVGAAALITGGAFAIGARRAQSAFDDAHCGNRDQLLGASAYASCQSEADRGQRDALLANAFLFGGGAVVVASAIVYALDPGNVERPEQQRVQVGVTARSIQLVVRW
jgi:tetratricopeptide (TPR) repeat protein